MNEIQYLRLYQSKYTLSETEKMSAIRFSEDVRPVSEFRANAAAFIEQIQTTHRPILLTQHGRGAAVLIDVAEYERLVERAEVLEDIRVAEEQIARGEGIEHEDAKQQLLARFKR